MLGPGASVPTLPVAGFVIEGVHHALVAARLAAEWGAARSSMRCWFEQEEQVMQKNMGETDRSLRGIAAVGAVVGSGLLGFSTAWGIVLLVAAAVMAGTAASGFCPIYRLLGIKTTGAPASEIGEGRTSHLHPAA